jgi:methionine synthase / methylenetetrahydrofolate reductase (NADH)
MGTMLYAKGVFINRSFDALNLAQPDLVCEVHREYIRAGADVIETNTFGANAVKLAAFGLADKLVDVNVAGARLARQAARSQVYVAGAIGPLGIRIEPWGKMSVEEATALFRAQATALAEGGVDLFILETFRDVNELGAAIAAVRAVCDVPVVAQMTTEEDGDSLDGVPPEEFVPQIDRLSADVIGVNCSVGPAPMLETIERMARVTTKRLSALPNAGRPRDIEGRNIYLSSPEYMASYARRFVQRGVRLVGGCCGTTPEHIRQIHHAVRALAPAGERVTVSAATGASGDVSLEPPVNRADKSLLARSLAEGHYVVTVELEPPKGHDAAEALADVTKFGGHGVSAIAITDGLKGGARMSALSLAILVRQHAGIEPVLQYACRDRYLIGMQSDLLGAHAVGVRNLVLFTGDPRKSGDYSDATLVFDVDSIGLTNAVARLNGGRDVGGQPIGRPTAFHIGVVANPTAPRIDEEVRRFAYKVEAGAEFAVTHPIYDIDGLDRFLALTEDRRVPLIAAIRPFDSLLHAEYLANEVPNVHVPDALIDRMRRADALGGATDEGVTIASELAEKVRTRVQGVQLSGVASAVLAVLTNLGTRA